MDRRNRGRPHGGPQDCPTPPPTYHQLQNQLNSAHEYINELKMKVFSLEQYKSQSQVTTENCHMDPKKKVRGCLEELLVNRAVDLKLEICHLKKTCQLQQDNYNEMVAKYEAEKEKVSDQNIQVAEFLGKMNQAKQQILQRDTEILDLRWRNGSLAQTLMEKIFGLNSKAAELQQSKKTWSAKCTALEDRFTKDLAEKEESWETRFNALQTMYNSLQENLKKEQAENKDWQKKAEHMEDEMKELEEKFTKDLPENEESWEIEDKQMEDEKKELEDLCLKLIEKRRGVFFRKRAGDRQEELEKLKSKMIQKEMKKTEKMEKAEKKKKEAKAAKDKKEKVEEEV